jgi:uncharacterized membrane protein YphA (DoxX/SURF4 family)
VLAGTLVPTTLAGHRFWEELDEDARNTQIAHFAKNLGLLGGLLLIATERTTSRSPGAKKKESKGRLRIRRGQ